MARDRRATDHDRLLIARLDGLARRNARWSDLAEEQKAGGAADLRDAAGDRADLLAEVAGIALGATESKGPEYVALGRTVAELCRMAGADEDLIPKWIEEGKPGRRLGGCRHSASQVGVRRGAAERGCQSAQHGPEPRTWQPPVRVISLQRRTVLLERPAPGEPRPPCGARRRFARRRWERNHAIELDI
jgi:hypothetical protein